MLSEEIATRLEDLEDALTRLDTIPGVERRTVEPMIAYTGTDRQRFASSGHLMSWAGFSPGPHESAGKAQPTRTRKGSKALRAALIPSGHAAGKTQPDLGAVYRRLAARRGQQRAAVAVGRHILIAVYHILRQPGVVYQDLGANDFEERDKQAIIRREVRRLEALGYRVALEPASEAS